MNYTIREMQETDIKSVQKVAKVSWNTTYENMIPVDIQDRFLQAAYSEGRMVSRLKHSSLFVAEKENQIVGFANFSPVNEKGEVELGAIYLEPAYQGRGIGSALLLKGIEKLSGVQSVFIDVEKENRVGIRFYKAKGFKTVAEFEDVLEGHRSKMLRMILEV
ncbi:GNAT family N-acetyltransferase [Shouchella patagoniensis]|uniref:GNAT family N-acetyltransferase n=1 Tax=Shouchella patagoniensis TaxID=228576 RepID=UPI0009950A94|nr:GNAT family N-acetyltransferase [Shouchella patagoniensis]